MKEVLKFVFKLLAMIILMPLYWISSFLVLLVMAVNSVIIWIGASVGFIIILVTLIEIVTKGDLKGNLMLLVLGALLMVVPAYIHGILEGIVDTLGDVLTFVSDL